jgi:hypothetical protein
MNSRQIMLLFSFCDRYGGNVLRSDPSKEKAASPCWRPEVI